MSDIDLQWFAAEDEGRTEEPTEYRLRKAREDEGRVAKSQELVGAVMLLFVSLTVLFLAPSMFRTCIAMIRFYFSRATEMDPTKDAAIFESFLSFFARLCLPIGGIALAAAIASNAAQVGLFFTTKPLAPKWNRVLPNFGQYFSKTVFSVNGIFKLGMTFVKIALFGGVAFFIIRSNIERLVNMQTMSLWTSFTLVASLAARLLIISALFMIALSIPDYMFQRWQFRESLRMTKQEIKDEMKEQEGDPEMKARLQQRMREILQSDLRKNVSSAAVVITNPTHLAIALQYEPAEMEGPVVAAKGEDEVAFRIRAIAKEYDIPIVENKPVARLLYPVVEVGKMVPREYWNAITEIIRRVLKLNEERRKR